MKVYCRDCAYYYQYSELYSIERKGPDIYADKDMCKAPKNEGDTYFEPACRKLGLPKEINRNNDCKWHKSK